MNPIYCLYMELLWILARKTCYVCLISQQGLNVLANQDEVRLYVLTWWIMSVKLRKSHNEFNDDER